MNISLRKFGIIAQGTAALVILLASTPAAADPVAAGGASSFAVTADVFGTNVVPPTPTAEVTTPAADEVNNTLIDIPASPLLINGTLIARAAVHEASDLTSELGQTAQSIEVPYNARAIGQIEDLSVLINEGVPGGQLVSAALIRAEAVAVCNAGTVSYSASSEVVDLRIGGEDPLSGPLNDLLKEITEGIAPLADLVAVDLNVVTATPTGASVDAVVVTLLQAAGDDPLVKVVLGHAEVSNVSCAVAEPPVTTTTPTTTLAPPASVPTLPVTGGSTNGLIALAMLAGAGGLLALRRKMV